MPRQFTDITKEILSGLAEAGKVALTGESAALGIRNWRFRGAAEYWENREEQRRLSQSLWRLKKERLVIVKEQGDGKFIVEITEKGRRKLREFEFRNLKIKKPAKWDRIWRIIIFDIPEEKRNARDALRQKCKDLEFYQLQKSVWVYPYPCEQEIEFIVELFNVYPYVNIIKAAEIKNDIKIRKHFHLS